MAFSIPDLKREAKEYPPVEMETYLEIQEEEVGGLNTRGYETGDMQVPTEYEELWYEMKTMENGNGKSEEKGLRKGQRHSISQL